MTTIQLRPTSTCVAPTILFSSIYPIKLGKRMSKNEKCTANSEGNKFNSEFIFNAKYDTKNNRKINLQF